MKLIVSPHKIEIEEELINEKEINITKCDFEFDDEISNEYVKEAYFTFGDNTYKKIISNDECDIPSEVLEEKGMIEIGVVAYKITNDEYEKRYNPSPIYIDTLYGSLKEEYENSSNPTPTEIEQLESQIQNKQDILTGIENYDATKTQILKNVNGVLTWVDE